MRILYAHNYYQQPGGEDRVFHDESQMLTEYGHQVEQWTMHNDDIKTASKIKTALNAFWNGQSAKTVREKIQRFKPDLVHFGNTFPLMSPAVLWECKKQGIPVVQTLHNFRLVCPGAKMLLGSEPCHKCVGKLIAYPGVFNRCYKEDRMATFVTTAMVASHRMIGTWHNKVDVFIALTAFSKDIFIEGGLPADKIIVKPNFVGDPEDAYKKKVDRKGLLYVGRLAEGKGIKMLLKGWKQFNRDVELTVIGQGPLSHLVEDVMKTDSRVKWVNQVSHDEVLAYMRKAEVCIVPSEAYETFGLTTIEANSVGTPVIGSDIGGTKEIVEHQKTGLLFRSGDADSLCEAMNQALDQPERMLEMGQEARKKFVENYTKPSNYKQLMDIYQMALSN